MKPTSNHRDLCDLHTSLTWRWVSCCSFGNCAVTAATFVAYHRCVCSVCSLPNRCINPSEASCRTSQTGAIHTKPGTEACNPKRQDPKSCSDTLNAPRSATKPGPNKSGLNSWTRRPNPRFSACLATNPLPLWVTGSVGCSGTGVEGLICRVSSVPEPWP